MEKIYRGICPVCQSEQNVRKLTTGHFVLLGHNHQGGYLCDGSGQCPQAMLDPQQHRQLNQLED
jgi:hypothetical protein